MPLTYIAISAMIVTTITPATMRSAPNLLILFMIAPRGLHSVSRKRLAQDSATPHADISFRYDRTRRQVREQHHTRIFVSRTVQGADHLAPHS